MDRETMQVDVIPTRLPDSGRRTSPVDRPVGVRPAAGLWTTRWATEVWRCQSERWTVRPFGGELVSENADYGRR